MCESENTYTNTQPVATILTPALVQQHVIPAVGQQKVTSQTDCPIERLYLPPFLLSSHPHIF